MDAREWEAVLDVLRRREAPRRTLEERIQLLEDKEQIRDLVMRYGFLTDAKRYDELFELYADDVERELGGTLQELVQGKDALMEVMRRPRLPRKNGVAGDVAPPEKIRAQEMHHLTVGEVIRVADDGTEAWVAAQFTMVKVIDDPDPTKVQRGAHEGIYVFRFRKVGDEWKFARLHVITNNAHNPLYQAANVS